MPIGILLISCSSGLRSRLERNDETGREDQEPVAHSPTFFEIIFVSSVILDPRSACGRGGPCLNAIKDSLFGESGVHESVRDIVMRPLVLRPPPAQQVLNNGSHRLGYAGLHEKAERLALIICIRRRKDRQDPSRGYPVVKDDRLYLHHMLERCRRITRFIGPGRETFMASEASQDAVIRNVEVIGEVAKRVSTEAPGRLLSLDWKAICGMRDVLIHDYIGVAKDPAPRRPHDIPLNTDADLLLRPRRSYFLCDCISLSSIADISVSSVW